MMKSDTPTYNVLLIGNNPIELGHFYEFLKNFKAVKFIPKTSFTLKDSISQAKENIPNCIVIDDNFKNKNIHALLKNIQENEETREIPVTVLKTSNFSEVNVSGISDFILKDGLSADTLVKSILNAMKFEKTRRYIYYTYMKRKRQVKNLLR